MKKSPYILKDLSIRKMPGFPSGMESLNDLAANVNIITGANASGKSSTARAIQELIWHNNTKGLSVHGSAKIEADAWEIDIDSGRIRTERNGIEEQLKGLPALEGHKRYLLALHNFVEGDENDLAKEIAKQSIGGFDLDAAQNELEYSSRIKNLGDKDFKKYEEADKKYKKTKQEQKELKNEEQTLEDLKLEKDKIELASKRNDFYNKVAEYLEAKLDYSQLTEQIKEYPESITKLSGNEHDLIRDYEIQIEDCKNKIEKATTDITRSQNELNKLTISENGIDEKTISEIEERLEKLGNLDRNISDFKSQITQEKTKEIAALNSVDVSINPSEWKNLDIHDISGLDKMLQDAHQVLGEKKFVISEIENLEEEAKIYQKENQRSETFIQGIKTLSEWLKEPTDSKGIPLKMVTFISALGLITAIATYFIGAIGLIGLVFIIGAFLFTYSKKGGSSNSLSVRENDFTKSGLKSPSHWNTENVANRIDELIENLRDCKESERISTRLKSCEVSLKKLDDRMKVLNSERQKWIDKLQTAPGFPENNANDFSSLYWFLTHVKNWQEANTKREVLEAQKTDSEVKYRDELDKVNALFAYSNLHATNDVTTGKAAFNELKGQENIRKEHSQIIAQRNEVIIEQERSKKNFGEKLTDIYDRIGIAEKNKDKIQELIKQLVVFKKIDQDHHTANQAYLKQERLLQTHSLYQEHREEVNGLAIDEAKGKATQNKEIAAGLEVINEKITTINTKIQERKKGHELEDLLTEKEEALDGLHALYEENLASTTGDLIISELKKETQNKNRPEVFKRANEIFSKITLGRYELKLNEKGNTSFEANDTVLKRSYDLSELSTGTRVQLLLSVRLAYVETVESSIKLPLLADELLANSDDERAKAIIEALIEISREGRQVFYFTAQADEVGKWQAHLAPTGLEHKVIQLNSKGNEVYTSSQFKPELSDFNFTNETPAPDGKNHQEYGEALAVPSFNLLTQKSSELPLWYLIEDLDLLYAVINRGLKTWGQLESYHKYNGKIENLDEAIFVQLSSQIVILERFQELHKIGRSTPIDRAILQASGAITSAYIDRVSDKLNELNGDPQLLLQALRNGEISRFRSESADELESYLLTERFIDDQEVMDQEDILIRMQAVISNVEMEIEEVDHFLGRIIG
jgi:uncharacterized protein YhaN